MWDKEFDRITKDITDRRGRGKDISITSLPHLDNSTWGISRQKLTIVAARPSQGKSAFLRLMTLDFIRQGKNVLVFSWEETKQNFTENLISLYGLVNNFDVIRGEIDINSGAFSGLKNILMKNNLHIIEKRGRTPEDFERLVRQPNRVDVVIVDYIQLIHPGSDERQSINEFIIKARELAKELDCAVIIASQINRSTIQNKQVTPPMLNEIKGSGALEEHADLVFLLHWDWFYNREDATKKNDYSIIVAKNKQTGKTFKHDCYFYPEYFKISEAPLDGQHKEYTT